MSTPLRFTLPDGARMNLHTGEAGASSFYYYGYPDHAEMMFLRKYLTRGDVFIDVGANSGGWSLTSFGLGAKIIAVEPVGSSFKRLQKNFELNYGQDTTKLVAMQLGIADKEGELYFTTNADAGNKVVDESTTDENVERVKVTKLDTILNGVSPNIIKIDVEGYELPVIHGAMQTLKKQTLRALIIETFRWANYKTDSLREIERILAEHNFFPVEYYPKNDKFIGLKEGEGGQNTIYVRKGEFDVE